MSIFLVEGSVIRKDGVCKKKDGLLRFARNDSSEGDRWSAIIKTASKK